MRKNEPIQYEKKLNQKILESYLEQIAIIEKNGEIIYVNKQWNNFVKEQKGLTIVLGKIGMNYFDLCNKLSKKEHINLVINAIKDALKMPNYIKSFEYVIKINNIEKWYSIHIKHYNDDEKSMLILRHLDITSSKKNEIYLGNIITELTDRYNELMQFNYIVSHNLRTPIVNILSLTKLLKTDSYENNSSIRTINYIQKSALKVNETLDDLNKIMNTKYSSYSKKENINIQEIIQKVYESLESKIKNHPNILNINISENAQYIYSIKSYFESIIYNLISNAIKYKSKERNLRLNINSQKKEDKIIIDISDNGIGIDLNKHKNHMFGLYKRFNNETEGKGLGLYMTKTEVELLGGSIDIDSEPGKGTKFTIKLPFKK